MKVLALIVLLAFAFAASADVFAVAPYTVEAADLACANDDDCGYAPIGCCAEAHCSFVAVNASSVDKYKEINAKIACDLACPAVMCVSYPKVLCIKEDPTAASGVCTIKAPSVEVPTSTVAKTCHHTGCGSGICSKEDIFTTCIATCEDACYAAATCKEDATSANGCAFVHDATLEACLEKCSPATVTCQVGGCQDRHCVQTSLLEAVLIECGKTEPTCQDKCNAAYGQCGATDAALRPCAWTSREGKRDLYTQCLAACGTTLPGEDQCKGLPCSDCVAKEGCSYCHLSYTAAASTEGGAASAESTVSLCVAASGSELCAAVDAHAVSSTTCPSNPTDPEEPTKPKPEAGDPTPFQAALDLSDKPVTEKFAIVITFIVKEVSSDAAVESLVKLFVDLIGTGTPSAQDKEEVCAILSDTLTKVESEVKLPNIKCDLAEQVQVKRDTKYVASLSYPSSSNNLQGGSASTLTASFVAAAVAAVAALF